MKKLLIVALLLMLSLLFVRSEKLEAASYTTWTYSESQDEIISTQQAYIPMTFQHDLGGETITSPEDITIDSEDNVYIADKGGKRVIKYSLKDDSVLVIGDGIFESPHGVHVGFDGYLYVADLGSKPETKMGYKLDPNNNYAVVQTYKKPLDSPYFTENSPFEVTKILTDQGNNVYMLLSGNTNGMVQYKNNGEFFGFFGANKIENNFENFIRSVIFSEEQRRDWFKMIPNPVYNMAIDKSGLVLTTTKQEYGYVKLNIANQVYQSSVWGFENNEDLFVGPYDTIFAVTGDGYIVEYGPTGDTLFIFGGADLANIKGYFKEPSGIAVDSKSNIYVIDRKANSLQILIPTSFADLIHHAIELYENGRYIEALEPWREVLKQNELFDIANRGIGDALYAQLDYEGALEYYEICRDQIGYSNAYWEVRNVFLQQSGTGIVIALAVILLLYVLNLVFRYMKYVTMPVIALHTKLKKFRIYNTLIYPFHIFKNPGDGYYGVKREKKGSTISALIYLLLFFAMYLVWLFNTSFVFNNEIAAKINLFQQILTIFLPFGLWVIANYLVCSIRDGEGRLKDVFQSTCYTLLPMIITFPLVTILSHFLTLNESFVYYIILGIGIGITVLYMIIMVKEVHFYDVKPTVFNIFITLFTAVMILAVTIIIYLLFSEVIGLIIDIVTEVFTRV